MWLLIITVCDHTNSDRAYPLRATRSSTQLYIPITVIAVKDGACISTADSYCVKGCNQGTKTHGVHH